MLSEQDFDDYKQRNIYNTHARLPAKMVAGPADTDVWNQDKAFLPHTNADSSRRSKPGIPRNCWTLISANDRSTKNPQSKEEPATDGKRDTTVRSGLDGISRKRPVRFGNDSPHKSYHEHRAERSQLDKNREDTKTLKRIRSLAHLRRETHIGQLGRRAKSDYECLRATDNLKRRADEFFKVIQSAKFKPHKIIEDEEQEREIRTGSLSERSIESIEKSARRGKLFVCQKIPYAKSTEPKLKDSSCQTKEAEVEFVNHKFHSRTQTDSETNEGTVINVVTTRHQRKKQVFIRKPKTKKQLYAFVGTLANDLPTKFIPKNSGRNRAMEDVDLEGVFPETKSWTGGPQSDNANKTKTNRRRRKDPTTDSFQEVRFQDIEGKHKNYNPSIPHKEKRRSKRHVEMQHAASDSGPNNFAHSEDENEYRNPRRKRRVLSPIRDKRSAERELDAHKPEVRMKTFGGERTVPRGVELLDPVKTRKSRRKKGRRRRPDDDEPDISESSRYTYDDVTDLASSRNKTRWQRHTSDSSPGPPTRRHSEKEEIATKSPSKHIFDGGRSETATARKSRRNSSKSNKDILEEYAQLKGKRRENEHEIKYESQKELDDKTQSQSVVENTKPSYNAGTSLIQPLKTKLSGAKRDRHSSVELTPSKADIEKLKGNDCKMFDMKSPARRLDRPTSVEIAATVPGFSDMAENGSRDENPSDASTDRLSATQYKEVIFSPGGRRKKSISNWVSSTLDGVKQNIDQSKSDPNICVKRGDQIPQVGNDGIDDTYKFSNIFERFRKSLRSRSLQPLKINDSEQSQTNAVDSIKDNETVSPGLPKSGNISVLSAPRENVNLQPTDRDNHECRQSTNLTADEIEGEQIGSSHVKSKATSETMHADLFKTNYGRRNMAKAGTPLIINELSNMRTPLGTNLNATVTDNLSESDKRTPSSISRYSELFPPSQSNLPHKQTPQELSCSMMTSVVESSTVDGTGASVSETSVVSQSNCSTVIPRSSLSEETLSTVRRGGTLRLTSDGRTESSLSNTISRAFSKLRSATAFSLPRPSSKVFNSRSLTDTILHSKYFRNSDSRSRTREDSESGRASQSTAITNDGSSKAASDPIWAVDVNQNGMEDKAPSHSFIDYEAKQQGGTEGRSTLNSFTPVTHSSGVGTLSDQGTTDHGNSQEDINFIDALKLQEDIVQHPQQTTAYCKPSTLTTIEENIELSEPERTAENRSNLRNKGNGDACIIEIPVCQMDTSESRECPQLTSSKACLTDNGKEKKSCCGRCWHFDHEKPWYMCAGKGAGWRILLGLVLLLLGPFIWFFYLFNLNKRIPACCGECWRWDEKEYWFSCKGKGCAWLFIFIPIYVIFGPLIFVFLLVTVFLVTCCGVSVPKRKSNKPKARGINRNRQAAAPRYIQRPRAGNQRTPKSSRKHRKSLPRGGGNEKFKHKKEPIRVQPRTNMERNL